MPSPTASTGAASSPGRRWSGSALVTAPGDLLLRPKSAYAAVCNCLGKSCTVRLAVLRRLHRVLLRDLRRQRLPPGLAHRRLVEGRRLELLRRRTPATTWTATSPAAACGCGGGGICSGACNGTPCGCGTRALRSPQGRLHERSATATATTARACIGPIQCRVVTCTAPWKIEPTCSSSAVRTDNNTRGHNRPCLQTKPAIYPVAGDWDGNGTYGIGFYDNRNGVWTRRQSRTWRRPSRRSPTGASQATGRSSATGTATASTASGSSARAAVAPLQQQLRHRRPIAPPDLRASRPATSPSSATGTATASTASGSSARAATGTSPTAPPTPQTVHRFTLRRPGRRHPRRRRLGRRRRRRRRDLPQGRVAPVELAVARPPPSTSSRFGASRATSPSSATGRHRAGTASASTAPGAAPGTSATRSPTHRRIAVRFGQIWVTG